MTSLKVLNLFLIGLFTTHYGSSFCPSDQWTLIPGINKCFQIVTFDKREATKGDVGIYFDNLCKNLYPQEKKIVGLAGFETERQLHLFCKAAQENFLVTDSNLLYIGLNDRQLEGQYRWMTSNSANTYLLPWSAGQPSDNNNEHTQLDCVVIEKAACALSDWSCTEVHDAKEAVCEISPPDLCADNKGGCDHTCTTVSFNTSKCGCRHGYKLYDKTKCRDIDECDKAHNMCTYRCVNSPGSFKCHCEKGYEVGPDGLTCQDDDECDKNNGGCLHRCSNTPGSFYCTCRIGFKMSSNGSCVDQTGTRKAKAKKAIANELTTVIGLSFLAVLVTHVVVCGLLTYGFSSKRRTKSDETKPELQATSLSEPQVTLDKLSMFPNPSLTIASMRDELQSRSGSTTTTSSSSSGISFNSGSSV